MFRLITLLLILTSGITFGQASIKVEVSADTIAPGETVVITYTIENGEGKLDMPDVTGLPLVSGPNLSSSFMIRNGEKSSSQSYAFIFRPTMEGEIILPEATYHEDGETQVIESVKVVVLTTHRGRPTNDTNQQSSKVVREKKKI